MAPPLFYELILDTSSVEIRLINMIRLTDTYLIFTVLNLHSRGGGFGGSSGGGGGGGFGGSSGGGGGSGESCW